MVTDWYAGLQKAAHSLYIFPRRNPRVQFGDFEGEVRRTIYGRGPSAYYIIYRIYDPGEIENEGIVRVLHVRYAAGQTNSGAEEETT